MTPLKVIDIETAVGYSHEQALISRRIAVELFLSGSEGRKRGYLRT
jgi:hypothetical protein